MEGVVGRRCLKTGRAGKPIHTVRWGGLGGLKRGVSPVTPGLLEVLPTDQKEEGAKVMWSPWSERWAGVGLGDKGKAAHPPCP